VRDGPFRVGVADELHKPGHQRRITVGGVLPGLALSTAEVPEGAEVTADLALEAMTDARVTVTGVVSVPYVGTCRRCLQAVAGVAEAHVQEVFEHDPVEEADTYPLDGDHADLEPMVRDAVLLSLPLAPLCRPDCPGPDPDGHPVIVGGATAEPASDPRWAALGDLKFD